VGGYGKIMKNIKIYLKFFNGFISRKKAKGFALFETLVSLLIITLLITPFISWISHIETLMEKEHQNLVEVQNAKQSLMLKTNVGKAKLLKNVQDKIIGVRFTDKEVKLLE
jgi:Tfp pilus assembly protein PilV